MAAAAAAVLGLARPSGDALHVDGPPLGHSGGFGEPTCRECHFDRPLNQSGGALTLEGLPERWTANQLVPLEIVLRRPDLARAGFQMTARFADGDSAGRQAGHFRTPDARVIVLGDNETGIHYVQHARAGTVVSPPGEARWRVTWETPPVGGAVTFHLAANAANDDDSEFGDRIYTRRYTSDLPSE